MNMMHTKTASGVRAMMLGIMVMANNVLNPAHKLSPRRNRRKHKGMALIKFGGGVVGMSGSIAGNTFARNRYGSYARARTKPTNPNSTAQVKVRSIMSTVRDAWSNTLTAAQRLEWKTYADNVDMLNALGETINLTGWNMFVRSNVARLYNDATLVEDGPAIFTLAEQDESILHAANAATDDYDVTFDDTMDWLDEDGAHLLVYEGKPQNATINYFDGPWILVGQVDGDSTTPPTSPASLNSNYTLTAGQKTFLQYRISRADGRLSNFFRSESSVV